MKKVLFVCSEGINRSVTAKERYSDRFETRSISILEKLFVNPKLMTSIEWADVIIVMEKWHADVIADYFELHDKPLYILNIPDKFLKGDPALINLLDQKMEKYIDILEFE